MSDLAYQDDDVLNWRTETVNGKIIMMAPPAINHQFVSGNILFGGGDSFTEHGQA